MASRLILHFDHPKRTQTLDYGNASLLDAQIEAYERAARSAARRGYELFEFRNDRNDLVAFVRETCVRVEIRRVK